jgi:hypothetical protein
MKTPDPLRSSLKAANIGQTVAISIEIWPRKRRTYCAVGSHRGWHLRRPLTSAFRAVSHRTRVLARWGARWVPAVRTRPFSTLILKEAMPPRYWQVVRRILVVAVNEALVAVGESTDVPELPVCRARQLDGRRAGNHAEHVEGNVMVRTRMNYNISLLAAAVAAMAIATAPSASAAPSEQPCFVPGSTCHAPGNVQIFSSPHALPAVFPHSSNPRWRGLGYNPRWPALGHNPKWQDFGYNPRWNGFQH